VHLIKFVYLVRRNFNGHNNKDVSFVKRTDHLINHLTTTDPYSGRTAPLTSKRFILYIYPTNTGTEYFKHNIYCPFFSLQNAICFIILTYLVPVLFIFYIQNVLKLKQKIIPAPLTVSFLRNLICPRFIRYNTIYSVNASIKKILHSECNCSVGFVLFNFFLLLFVFHKVTSISDPHISLKMCSSRILPEKLCFLKRAL